METIGEREIWGLEREQDQNLLDVNDSTMFYNDFLSFPEFPCMSSSSSSPAPAKPIGSSSSTTSSSSSSSQAALKSDVEEDLEKNDQVDAHPPNLSCTSSMEPLPPSDVDSIDLMESFGYLDLIDGSDIWDPSSIFENNDQNPQNFQNPEQDEIKKRDHDHEKVSFDELGVVFFEWLKSNKEYISAQDMRSIKLSRATIESASKRLGTTKEGQKQLLKLILEWVEQHQLHKKSQFQNPNPNPNLNPNPFLSPPTSWNMPPPVPPPPPYVSDPSVVAPAALPVVGYMGSTDPYANGTTTLSQPYQSPTEYQMMDSGQTWSQPQYNLASQYNTFQENNNVDGLVRGYGNQYPYNQYYQGNGGEKLVRLGPSATKEARKKRMARQRRLFSHHRHNHHSHNHQNQNQNQSGVHVEPHARVGGENWVYWTSTASAPAIVPPGDTTEPHSAERTPMQVENFARQVSSDRRQGWKSEKNLKFLLQKVLKQSDVGNLGRIVLPKKEAETHLPELEARDGIPIAMEDIGTSCVWNMRYRFWPNNKSRMYLLENTGDFVRANGLQEGDFIVLYSDVKCGKYLIRGVKVRQPGPKLEGKRAAKNQRNIRITSPAAGIGNGSSSSQPSQKQ